MREITDTAASGRPYLGQIVERLSQQIFTDNNLKFGVVQVTRGIRDVESEEHFVVIWMGADIEGTPPEQDLVDVVPVSSEVRVT